MADDQPAATTPEYLESGAGTALPDEGGRRPWLLVGAGVAGVALLGGAAWGAWWWFADGAQAAEALPASAVGYVGLTLDPSGSQKVEALSTLRRLPAIAEELDLDGPLDEIDLKQALGTAFLDTAPCEGLSYAEHLEPWLGDRLGVAAVPVGEEPQPVLALEVSDEDAVEDGLGALVACGAGDSGEGGQEGAGAFEVRDGWVLVAPDEDVLAATLDDLEEGTLADDEDFRRWTGEAGEPGIVTMYAAPAVADYLQDAVDELFGGLGEPAFGAAPGLDTVADTSSEGPSPQEQLQEAIDSFEGAAATIRFVDGAVELEMAGGWAESDLLGDAEDVGDAGSLVSSLPEGTVLAAAAGLAPDGLEQLDEDLGGDAEDLLGGLLGPVELDLAGLLGDAVALAVGPDLDVEGLVAGTTTDLPIALLTTGELAAAQEAAEGIGRSLGAFLGIEPVVAGEDGRVVLGLEDRWTDEVAAEDGSLGQEDRFERAVPDAEGAGGLLYLDADALVELVRGSLPEAEAEDDEVVANLEPLEALGLATTMDDGTVRLVLRLTTD